jgi:hypothetical protein
MESKIREKYPKSVAVIDEYVERKKEVNAIMNDCQILGHAGETRNFLICNQARRYVNSGCREPG